MAFFEQEFFRESGMCVCVGGEGVGSGPSKKSAAAVLHIWQNPTPASSVVVVCLALFFVNFSFAFWQNQILYY